MGELKGADATAEGLTLTLQWLAEHGKQVILLGPVPVYKKSVPLALALEASSERRFARSTSTEQYGINGSFFKVIESAQPSFFDYYDPIKSMCTEKCVVIRDGEPLYRDSDHLSATGAMSLKSDLDRLLNNAAH